MEHNRLIASAKILKIAVWAVMLAFLLAYAIARSGLDLGPNVRVLTNSRAEAIPEAAYARDAAMLFFLIALYRLTRALDLLAAGQLFTVAVAAAFRGFAFWLLLSALLSIFGPVVAALVHAVSGNTQQVELMFNLRDMIFVIAAALMFLVARMLDAAATIDSELREIV